MKRSLSFVILSVLVAAPAGRGAEPAVQKSSPAAAESGSPAKKLTSEQEDALAAIKGLGGKLEYDRQGALSGVDLRKQEISGSQLAPLGQIPHLKTLILWGPGVSDATLAPLAALKDLTDLE